MGAVAQVFIAAANPIPAVGTVSRVVTHPPAGSDTATAADAVQADQIKPDATCRRSSIIQVGFTFWNTGIGYGRIKRKPVHRRGRTECASADAKPFENGWR